LAWGNGTGYLLNLLSSAGLIGWFSDKGWFYINHWLGSQVTAPSDSTNSFDFADGKTQNLGVATTPDHSGTYPLQVGGEIKATNLLATALTASTPVLTNANKELVSGQIDLGNSVDVKATGITAPQILIWSAGAVAGIGPGIYGTVDAMQGGSASLVTVVTGIGGTIPPGMTVTTGFAVYGTPETLTFTDGILTAD
jgi:hypothetical protein